MARKAQNRITGEEQESVPTIVVIPPHCPSCLSTNRSNLEATVRHSISGEINGIAYSTVVWSRTHCLDCGQCYTVKTFTNE